MNNREPIGLKSLSGLEILEGSTVAIHAQRHEVVEVIDEGDDLNPRIEHVDINRRLPTTDVVLAHGHVYWDTFDLSWRCRLVWKCRQWEEQDNGIASLPMGGAGFAFEIIDQ